MKVAIIGAGAMGSLYGGYLSKSGKEVYLVDIWKDHIDTINKEGLTILEEDKEIRIHPVGVTDSEEIGIVDLAIVFVKSINTKSAMSTNLSIIGSNTIVLSLQNGYGNAEDIEDFVEKDNIVVGTTSHGATMIGPGRIKHAGKGKTYIGRLTGNNDESISRVRNVLLEAGFETEISDNVMELIWSKLLVNVGINAITSILEIKNGQILDFEEGKEILSLAVSEGVKVAKGLGLNFEEEDVIRNVVDVAKATFGNKSSMLQDILNKRKTEIERINGTVVKMGEKLEIDTPVNLTLTNLVKVKEKLG